MYKGFLLLVPAGFIGAGLAIRKYLDNTELAECENFSVSSDLALKNLEKERMDDNEIIESEIENLQNMQESLCEWENSNLITKIIQKPPVRNKTWYENKPHIGNLEKNVNIQLNSLKEKMKQFNEC